MAEPETEADRRPALQKGLDGLRRRLATHVGSGRDTFPPAAQRAIDEARTQAAIAEGRLRTAIEAMPEGVVVLDEEGRYVLWNQRYAEIYHRSADLFQRGRLLSETLRIGVARGDYPDAVGREEQWVAERLTTMKTLSGRHEQRLADGRWIMIEERRTADGGAVGIRVDITEMKKAEAALQQALDRAEAANRVKAEFLANMSHEIRTPLNGVVGMAHVLNGTALDSGQKKLLARILESAASLEQMLTDVLDLTRIEAGRLDVGVAPFDLSQLVAAVAVPFERLARGKGLQFETWIDPAVPTRLRGDEGRLRQVLSSLLSNALKFTAKGAVSLRVFPADRPGHCVFQVRDTGVGFDPAKADTLFGRFVQADGSTTRDFGGSGLGLAICRELTQMMGGVVTASGAPGQGAVFRVELPLEREAAGLVEAV